ncbi:hypothetical protein TNCV_3427581 [Trichonephila clavipes]|nr:hypothetical protein TNCV_3427581 [Trichonephila clavipes]
MVSISRSPERSRFTDFGSPPIPMSVLWIAKGDIFDMVLFGSEINKNRVCAERVSMLRVEKTKMDNVHCEGLWSGREKKKRKIGMARKRAENREGSLGFPGFVKPVFTKTVNP